MGKEKGRDDSDLLDPHLTAITQEYEMLEVIGNGHFAKVRKGRHRLTGQLVAVKIITKPAPAKMKMLKAEVDIMTKLDHPNVVRLHKVVDTETKLYLVMELLTGGELFDRIVAKGHYSEADARTLTRTIVSTMAYLHSQGVAHRDLKPENILLATDAEDAAMKITDFGLSRLIDETSLMTTACGTPGYVAPEVITHEAYSTQIDMWSVGVIVYILLCGFPPFYGENDAQMFRKIRSAQYKFLAPYWDGISAEAKDFVAKLLVVDPHKRMTARAALSHEWLALEHVSTRNLFGIEAATESLLGALSLATGNGGSATAAAKGEAGKAAPEGGGHDGHAQAAAASDGHTPSDPRRISVAADGGHAPACVAPLGPPTDRTADGLGAKRSMQQLFREYNFERKVSGHEQILRAFRLPADAKILDKYQCGLENKPGRLYLASSHLCFIALSGHKYAVPLVQIAQLVKAKRFRFSPGHGHSIHVITHDNKLWQFTGVLHRDETLQAILRQCHSVNVHPEVFDVGNAPLASQAGGSNPSSQPGSRRPSITMPPSASIPVHGAP
ncbi:hypothetical protein KFE25_011262 [Diacronema lutheri]|uniref:Protein kinase domain-containing protein n=2 Tax=Diacronema lutheri TaxID=2081491 RepID=A0A8J6CB32_DIALT|nr:hypothetical protein KFE25_011262 [Diacronema lutheri]